jgi:uncharacterized membrane protein YagU involved in acid resistance
MNIVGAVVAGIVGTAALSMVLAMAPAMGMPEMDIVGMLGSMLSREGHRTLGWIMHFMMGVIFAIIYAALWSAGIGSVNVGSGALFGVVHWLAAGLVMGAVPMLHAGIRAGKVQAPGIYMLNSGGMLAFMGGLIGHVIYGVVVTLVYGAFGA